MRRENIQSWVEEALKYFRGSASIVLVSKYIWDKYELELRSNPQFFFTWQYEIRWAAFVLRDKGIMKPDKESAKGIWELVNKEFTHVPEDSVNRRIDEFVPIFCDKQCVLRDDLGENVLSEPKEIEHKDIHYIAGTDKALGTDKKTSAKKDINHVKSFLKGTKHLTIVDPYFFKFDKTIYRTREEYLEVIQSILPEGLKRLEVYHLEGPENKIKNPFKKYCHDNQIQFSNYGTSEIHDRVLIKEGDVAKIVGTSFGGLGNKLAFIVNLPDDDLREFKNHLHRIKVHIESSVPVANNKKKKR